MLAGKRFPLVSLPFRTLCEVLFEWPPQCPTISVCYISLSLFLPIDRPIRSISCSFSLALALSDFSINYSQYESLSLALFYLFALSLSLAQKLSIGQQEICVRHDRILRLSVILLCFVFFFWLLCLSHSSRISHTTGRIVRLADFPAPLYAVRLLVVRRSHCFERVHPFNFVHFASEVPPMWISFRFLFDKTHTQTG